MKNNITELVCILDRSGSMSGLESDTVGGFNAMIEKQKKQNGECFMFGPEIEIRNNFDRELEEIIDRHCFKKLDAFRATGSLK